MKCHTSWDNCDIAVDVNFESLMCSIKLNGIIIIINRKGDSEERFERWIKNMVWIPSHYNSVFEITLTREEKNNKKKNMRKKSTKTTLNQPERSNLKLHLQQWCSNSPPVPKSWADKFCGSCSESIPKSREKTYIGSVPINIGIIRWISRVKGPADFSRGKRRASYKVKQETLS